MKSRHWTTLLAALVIVFCTMGSAQAWNTQKEKACKKQVAQAEGFEQQFYDGLDTLFDNPVDTEAQQDVVNAEQGLDDLVKHINGYKKEITEARRNNWAKAVRKYKQYAGKIDEVAERVKVYKANQDVKDNMEKAIGKFLDAFEAEFAKEAADLKKEGEPGFQEQLARLKALEQKVDGLAFGMLFSGEVARTTGTSQGAQGAAQSMSDRTLALKDKLSKLTGSGM